MSVAIDSKPCVPIVEVLIEREASFVMNAAMI